jgi:hypothetical protein
MSRRLIILLVCGLALAAAGPSDTAPATDPAAADGNANASTNTAANAAAATAAAKAANASATDTDTGAVGDMPEVHQVPQTETPCAACCGGGKAPVSSTTSVRALNFGQLNFSTFDLFQVKVLGAKRLMLS